MISVSVSFGDDPTYQIGPFTIDEAIAFGLDNDYDRAGFILTD